MVSKAPGPEMPGQTVSMLWGMGVECQMFTYRDGTKGRAGASGKQEVLALPHWLFWSVEAAVGTLKRRVC